MSSPDASNEETVLAAALVDGIIDGTLFGWVLARRRPTTGLVVITIGDRKQLSTHLAPTELARGTGHLRFRIALDGVLLVDGDSLAVQLDGESAPNPPRVFSATHGFGHFDGIWGISCRGWAIGPANARAELELCVDGRAVRTFRPTATRDEFVDQGISSRRLSFDEPLPAEALDGEVHTITIRFAETRRVLPPGDVTFRFAPIGSLDRMSPDSIEGWVVNPESNDGPIALEAIIDGTRVATGASDLVRGDVFAVHGRSRSGYFLPVDEESKSIWRDGSDVKRIDVVVAGTDASVLPRPHHASLTTTTIATLEHLAATLATAPGDLGVDELTASWLRRTAIPELLARQRTVLRHEVRTAIGHPFDRSSRTVHPVDVIIPVYKGLEETLACIESVLAARVVHPYRLIVIDDRSPDPELSEALVHRARRAPFTLLRNDANLGFVQTVNRGMAQSTDNDVVLLNSDTLVPDGWLDALVSAAYSRANVATVTPLSNRATICSVPLANVDNDMPVGFDVHAMNAACARVGDEAPIDIPSAVGFCMFIRRAALREVGDFDADRWQKGYGEENDFSVRARGLGWRNVATTRAFVQHHGSVSFGAEKSERVRENLAQLTHLYPEYDATIRSFLRADPLRHARNRLAARILATRFDAYVVHVTHAQGGGTETAIRDLARGLAKQGVGSLVLRPDSKTGWVVATSIAGDLELRFDLTTDFESILGCLRDVGTTRIHVHHVLGHDESVADLAKVLGIPFDVTVHDFFLACPRVTLLDTTGSFCGQPPVDRCETCVSIAPLEHAPAARALRQRGGSVRAFRDYNAEWLGRAESVFAPSDDAASRIRSLLALTNVVAKPHTEPAIPRSLRRGDGRSVAVLGAIGDHKGFTRLLQLCRLCDARDLPLEFHIVGFTRDDDAFGKLKNVRITGKYDPDELGGLLDDAGAAVALFLSPWPETFSYTLSEALENGLFPIALDIGAFRERIAKVGRGAVLPQTASVDEIADALLRAVSERRTST